MTGFQVAARRETKFAAAALERVQSDGTFTGYASLFGERDLGNDVVEQGAFARSLERRGASGIRMLWQHDPAEPIGIWRSIIEDGRGLRVTGKLTSQVGRGREVLALMREGAIDGLSIGFRTVRARGDKNGSLRHIIEADLWEISVVTFPMLPGARVETVKADMIQAGRQANCNLPTTREFERWLMQDAGLTRSEARLVIHKGFAQLPGRRDAANAFHRPSQKRETSLAERMRQAASSLRNGN
ncbi:MAG: HK97 family phage prohead protease [Nitratireductor sp.]